MAVQFKVNGNLPAQGASAKQRVTGLVPKRESQEPIASDTTKSVPANGSATSTRSTEKYQRILDAAMAVIAEKGFFTARISDIAKRADVADGTVYLYFKSKEEILMKAINAAFDGFMRHARTELGKIASPEQQLRRLAYLHLEAMGSNRNAAIVFQMELRQSTRFLEEFSHEHMVEYFALVREAIRRGQ